MRFYLGSHLPWDAHHLDRAFISYNRLRNRVSDIKGPDDWVMDSGAYTQIDRDGEFVDTPEEYAEGVKRWSECGNLVAAVSQDFMCEPEQREQTGGTIQEHQKWTIERYDRIRKALNGSGVYLMPVLQGWHPEDYFRHIEMYGDRLDEGQWVGVGSVCQRNSHPADIIWILDRIKEKSSFRLHGFGVKATALQKSRVVSALYSADSMAWSFWARRTNRDANDWRNALKWKELVLNRKATDAPLYEFRFGPW